jgi:hypothetical protein
MIVEFGIDANETEDGLPGLFPLRVSVENG